MTSGWEEYVPKDEVIECAKPAHLWQKEWHKVNSQDGKQSPEMPKKGKARQLKSPQTTPPEILNNMPACGIQKDGMTRDVRQFLEVRRIHPQHLRIAD